MPNKSKKQARRTITRRSNARPILFNGPSPIVAIGASAGGLEAVTQLLQPLSGNTGLTFVVIQHLDPTHESALTSLLSRVTPMRVTEAKNNLRLEPNNVYVIPPNKIMRVSQRHLKLSPRVNGKVDRMPTDHFFLSLAQEEGERAVGIILSGNGSDGTQGLQAIKSVGGITFAQAKKTAKFPSMPASAIDAGCVDFILPPEKMARELARIAGHLAATPVISADAETANIQPNEERVFEEILGLLRQRMAVDFTFYKHATLRRRMSRRMVLQKIDSLAEYRDYLRAHAGELKELFSDILIHVTGFFRDAPVFQALKRKTLPRLLRNRAADTLRIWVPGCSTGQEVYSLAILLMELMADKNLHRPVQIFGTDINEAALNKARIGVYPENIKTEVSPDRLRKFFTRTEAGFRINKNIREMCIFARQNLAMDPPFSNIDLVSCRNVLIYLGPALQRKVMSVFHYALRTTGLLLLGASETIGGFADLFSQVDKKAKLYAKKASHSRPLVSFSRALPEMNQPGEAERLLPVVQTEISPSLTDVQKQADRVVLTGYSPAGVVVNKHMEVLQFRGHTGLYLEHPHGEANLNLFKMAREGLLLDLRAVVARALKQNVRVRQEHVRVRQNGHFTECSIEVVPFKVPPTPDHFYLILFEPQTPPTRTEKTKPGSPGKKSSMAPMENIGLADLREELAATRASLQSIIGEHEATNEELHSANEEIMSSNEELQSTNEELETAKEELQSTNEELTTLNDELEGRNIELEKVNNDLHNLLTSVTIPVIILNSDLRIRRFTTAAEKLLKLIPGDVGRPITDLNIPLPIPDLEKEIDEVLETLAPRDLELQDKKGHWWSVRIRAYKTTDSKIDGAIIAFVDVDLLKTSMDRINQSRSFAEAIVNTVREPLLVLDGDLIVKSANQTFYRKFRVDPAETIGRHIHELGNGQWNIKRLRTMLNDILTRNSSFNDFEVEHNFPLVGQMKLVLNARRLSFDGDATQMILLAMEEVGS